MKQILKYIYSVLSENIKFAESKHSILIALNSALVVFISSYLVNDFIVVKLLTCLIIVFAIISLFFSFMALFSRKVAYEKNYNFKDNELNLIYYKHIINFSYDEYLKEIIHYYNLPKNYSPDGLDNDLAKQIVAISLVTNLKFTFFNVSLIFLFFELILSILNIVLVGLGV